MILNPYKQRKIIFYDWDDTLIGVLCLPEVIVDTRPFVNFFVGVNMIYPDLQVGIFDTWADERRELHEQAIHDWPRRAVYPEESWYFKPGEEKMVLHHLLQYKPGQYIQERSNSKAFRPKKEEKDG